MYTALWCLWCLWCLCETCQNTSALSMANLEASQQPGKENSKDLQKFPASPMTCTESMPSSKWMNGHAFNAFMLHSSSLKGATFSCFVTTLCCTASSNHQTHKSQTHCHGSSSLLCQHVQEPQGSTEENHPHLRCKCPTKLQHWKIPLRQGAPKKYLAYHQHSCKKHQKTKLSLFQNNTSTFASMPSHGAPPYNWHLLEYLEPNT